jgi:hypothetical protein
MMARDRVTAQHWRCLHHQAPSGSPSRTSRSTSSSQARSCGSACAAPASSNFTSSRSNSACTSRGPAAAANACCTGGAPMATRREAVHFLEAAGGPNGQAVLRAGRREAAVPLPRWGRSAAPRRTIGAIWRPAGTAGGGDTSGGGHMRCPRRFGATVHHGRSSFDSTERATIRTGFRGREELRWMALASPRRATG